MTPFKLANLSESQDEKNMLCLFFIRFPHQSNGVKLEWQIRCLSVTPWVLGETSHWKSQGAKKNTEGRKAEDIYKGMMQKTPDVE